MQSPIQDYQREPQQQQQQNDRHSNNVANQQQVQSEATKTTTTNRKPTFERFDLTQRVRSSFKKVDDQPPPSVVSNIENRRQPNDIIMISNQYSRNGRGLRGAGGTSKFISVLICICILQAVIILGILGLIYYNKWPLFINLINNNNNNEPSATSNYNQATIRSLANYDKANIYRVYTNGQNTSKILVDLPQGCNQREHDFPFGVACHSAQLNTCKRVELLSSHKPSEEFEAGASNQRTLTIITSSKTGKMHEVRMSPIRWVNNCQASEQPHCHFKTRLTVYLAESQQTILGWGGALTDSSINNILSLSVNGTRSLLDDYYSKERGLGYNLVRITVGGSDFSGRFYTNDDVKLGSEDLNLDKFKLLEEDTLYKIPLLKMIQTDYEQPVKLFGSIWSPPLWMKTNHHFNKGQLRGAIGTTTPHADRYFHALAELKARFVDAYQRESIKFWGLTVMNEPFFAKQPFLDFNTMIFPTNDYATYVATILGPRFKHDESLRHIKLMVHDDNRKFLRSDTEQIVNRTDVQRFIDGIATHGYVDEDFGALTEIWEKYKGRFFILPDELCSGHLPFMEKALIGNWDRGIHYAIDIIKGLQNRAAGWVDWNMALDINGGPSWLGGRLDSPIIVDKVKDTYYKSPMYYTMGHFSRYIPEGSVKIADKIINNKYDFRFETATFITPNKRQLVTVILNQNPYNIELVIEPLKSSGHIAPRQNAGFQIVVEPESVTTILYPLPSEYTNPAMSV